MLFSFPPVDFALTHCDGEWLVIRLQLSPEEYAYLDQTRRTSRSQVAERCHYVLLNASGCSVPQIAQRLERHEHKWVSKIISKKCSPYCRETP